MNRGILASREELTALRDGVSRKPFDTIYQALRQRCALILEAPPVTEPQWRALWQSGSWGSAIGAAKTTQGRIFDLLIAHHIDPNRAYRDRAVEELDNLVGWTTWVDPCNLPLTADLCTAEAAVAAVVGLDWLWEDLDEAHRDRILQAVRVKALQPYRKAISRKAWWYTCYHHWNPVLNSGLGLAAAALADEEPNDSPPLHQRALAGLKPFFDVLGREGGWDEGTGYWGYAMRYLLLFGEALRRLHDDQTIFHRRGMSNTGLFPVYFTPNGRAASFGDWPAVPLYGTLYLLTRHYDLPALLWWLDTYAFQHDVINSSVSAAGLALLFRPPDVQAPSQPKLEPVKVFLEVGWTALADRWPRPAFYAAIKAGDLSAYRSQRDMNSLQLQVDGEMLLTDLGNAPLTAAYFSDARAEFYEVQARAHNTIIVAERDHRIDAHGQVVESGSGPNYAWVACDAKGACGENTEFVRHLVLVTDPSSQAGQMLVVLDEVANGVPEMVEMFWHTQGRLDFDSAKKAGNITGRHSAVAFALASTVAAEVRTREHKLDRGRCDRVLCLSAGVVGSELFASVFSRRKPKGPLALERRGSREVTVSTGPVTVRFAGGRGHLKLAGVDVKG